MSIFVAIKFEMPADVLKSRGDVHWWISFGT